MKGIANWIMIMGSVIIGITILFIGASLIMKQMRMSEKQSVLGQIQDFHSKIENTCHLGKGSTHYYTLALPSNVRSVYVANSSYELPPDKVSEMITKKESSSGNYLCIQFFDDNLPICQEIGCMTNFTYIGSPSLKNTLQTLIASLKGKSSVYEYRVVIEKTDDYLLTASLTVNE